MNINPHLPSDYINYLENPMEIINEAERVAEKDIWSLMQFTENLRRQYGKEPRSMEILLKKLYVRRMAADIGVTRIYSSGKTVFMKTNISKKVFKIMIESMASDTLKNSLVLEGDQIKVIFLNFSFSLIWLPWLIFLFFFLPFSHHMFRKFSHLQHNPT